MTVYEALKIIFATGGIIICVIPLLIPGIVDALNCVEKKINEIKLDEDTKENPCQIYDEFARYMGKKPGEPIEVDQSVFVNFCMSWSDDHNKDDKKNPE